MNRDDDAKEDKRRDAFNPGVTREQIEKAEKLLGGLDMPLFVERRNLGQQLRTGILHQRGGSVRAEVKVSVDPVDDDGRHLVLSQDPLPAIGNAEISIEHGDRVKVISGSLESSQRGRRSEDAMKVGVLRIAFLHPKPS